VVTESSIFYVKNLGVVLFLYQLTSLDTLNSAQLRTVKPMEVDYGVYLEPCCAPEAPPCLPSPVTGGLPTGFPQAAPGAMAWKAEDIRYEDYVHDFFDEEVFELENALRSFKGQSP
jgi:hypothetical protein